MIDTVRIGGLEVLVARSAPQGRARAALRPPVLFIHGFFATASVWSGWLPRFALDGVSAFAINLRGRGNSAAAIGSTAHAASIDDFVHDATTVAAAIAVDGGPPTVVGHSMGGLIAQRLAANGSVRAAVLLTPAPPRGIPILSLCVSSFKQLKYLPALITGAPIVPDLEDLREVAFNAVPADAQDAALATLVPDSGRAGRELSLGYPVDRAAVRCPLYIVAAEHDRFIPPAVVARVARRYGVPLETRRGRGHMLIIEPGWERLADDVVAWMSRL